MDTSPVKNESLQSPIVGTVWSLLVTPGEQVTSGQKLVVLESMKMEHAVTAVSGGVVDQILVTEGQTVAAGQELISLKGFSEPGQNGAEVAPETGANASGTNEGEIRPQLQEVFDRHGFGLDENRPEAVARLRTKGKRTARENLAELIDEGSLVEYGPLTIAAQRKRRSVEELIRKTPGDGLIGGIASVNGEDFPEASQCVVVSYDYMVLAGTQGHQNHRKKDRLFELAHDHRLPVILFAEGGGGRPGDTDGVQVAGLDCLAFGLLGALSGEVPLVGINTGYCFAGNAALIGCCDVIISTRNANLGMAGPAMIEGGGLGVYHPSEIGPVEEQEVNGVIDITVEDEAEAIAAAKQYLSYFQGPIETWEAPDPALLRDVVPENRREIYDVHSAIEGIFDVGSILELRPKFGIGMVTALARYEGKPVGVIANNPVYLAGAIDSDNSDKSARFMQLCDAHDIPIVFLCDTPGFMVGPDVERTGLVRHASRLFVTGSSITVPFATIVLRKGYGLGAQAMAGGGFKNPMFTVAWPTSEFGGMGLEGFVRLGYRDELAAIEDPAEREAEFQKRVDKMYEVGKGVSMADHFEIDDVIDPAETRSWISMLMAVHRPDPNREARRRPAVDTW